MYIHDIPEFRFFMDKMTRSHRKENHCPTGCFRKYTAHCIRTSHLFCAFSRTKPTFPPASCLLSGVGENGSAEKILTNCACATIINSSTDKAAGAFSFFAPQCAMRFASGGEKHSDTARSPPVQAMAMSRRASRGNTPFPERLYPARSVEPNRKAVPPC